MEMKTYPADKRGIWKSRGKGKRSGD